jgi:hypothetical protein
MAAASFALVLLFGLMMLRTRSAMHPLAIATLWFGLLGGSSGLWVLWLAAAVASFSAFAFLVGFTEVLGMSVSLFGAGLARLPERDLAGRKLIDRNRSGALLVCAGATMGLIASSWTFGFLTLLSLPSFTLVLLFGVLMLQSGQQGRLLAAATLYFALVGVAVELFFLPGVIAAVVAGTGSIVRLYSGGGDDMSGEASVGAGRDWLAGALVTGGAGLGLIVLSPLVSRLPFALFGEIAFAFVLILGLVLFARQPVGRVLAAGAAWFAILAGAVSIAFLVLGVMVGSGGIIFVGVLGIVAMAISLVGARIKLQASDLRSRIIL